MTTLEFLALFIGAVGVLNVYIFTLLRRIRGLRKNMVGLKTNRDYYRNQCANLQRRYDALWNSQHPAPTERHTDDGSYTA